jgi:hypothetical protein
MKSSPVVSRPASSHVRHPDRQPEREGKVDHREDRRIRLDGVRIGIHRDGRQDEAGPNPHPPRAGEGAVPGKVRGDERQDEEADVERVEEALIGVQRDPEELGQLDHHACRHGQGEGDPHRPGRRARGRAGTALSSIAGEDELLPEAVGVLPRELPCQRIDGPHPPDRHQEGLLL